MGGGRMREKYYSRISPDGKKEELIEHLKATGERAAKYGKVFGMEKICYFLGSSHDIGKHTEYFQQVLEHKMSHIDHAWPGAIFWNEVQKQARTKEAKDTYELVKMVVADHHSNLVSKGEPSYKLFDIQAIMREVLSNREELDKLSNRKFAVSDINELMELKQFVFSNKLIAKLPEIETRYISDNLNFMLTARMLYSCLVDADYTSSAMFYDSNYEDTNTASLSTSDIDKALESLDNFRSKIKDNSLANAGINALRDRVYEDCANFSKTIENDMLCKLSAPTGLGKTLALLKIGLEVSKRLSKDRIIVVLPFLSLVEEARITYEKIFGAENVLVDTSTVDTDTDRINREMIARWSAKVIITTNVNFFESLFQSRSTKCRKLHNIANSVVLFDESQTLPPNLLKASLATLLGLVKNFKVTMVLSTATQPDYSQREDLTDYSSEIHEIISDVDRLYNDYSQVKRIKYTFSINKDTYESLAKYAQNHHQILYMLNTKKQVRKLYEELKAMYPAREVIYITTNLCPAHRIDILRRVKDLLADGQDLIVVSSQCIEAGVDFDFPVLFRQYAPFEALVQSAGRCNRNCKTIGEMHIFRLDEKYQYPSTDYQNAAGVVLHMNNLVTLNDIKQLNFYFSKLYKLNGYDKDKSDVSDGIKNRDFKAIADNYKIIENASQINIITDYDQSLYDDVYQELSDNDYCISKMIMKRTARVTVSTFIKKEILKHCTQLYIRTRDGKEPTNWFIVEPSVGVYDNIIGLSVD